MNGDLRPDTYDRLLGALDGLPGVTTTKPATIETITPLLGTSQTFIVRTFRQTHQDDDGKTERSEYTIFLKYVEGTTATKLAVPPRVAEAIARQRDSLATQARTRAAKRAAATRKASGFVSTFTRKQGGRS